jgi:RNA polymerase sigma factor for flagellar operon FliA
MSAVSAEQIRGYLPLVHQVVAAYSRRLPANVQRDDLLSAGVFGLVDSLRRRREGSDAFEPYARVRIRGAVVDELRAQDWLSRRARDAAGAAHAAGDDLPPVHVSLTDLPTVEATLDVRAANDSPEDRLVAALDRRVLARALDALPERERLIVAQHFFDGLRLREIAASLGVSEPRVSQILSRALERLRAFLARAA